MPPRTAGYMLEKRQAILAAAFECFSEKGVPDTGMADIARKAGTSAGALYKHFASRDDVLEAVMSQIMEDFYRERNGQSWPEMRGAILNYALFGPATTDDDRALVHAINTQGANLVLLRNPILRRKAEEAFTRAHDWLAEGLERLDQTGEVKLPVPAEAAARHLIDAMMGCALSIVFRPRDPAELARSMDAFVGFNGAE